MRVPGVGAGESTWEKCREYLGTVLGIRRDGGDGLGGTCGARGLGVYLGRALVVAEESFGSS